MTPEQQRSLVLQHLDHREQIISETRRQLDERERSAEEEQLAQVDPAVRRAAEDEFYAQQGRFRYVTSDGRVLFLTPEETARRRHIRARRSSAPAKAPAKRSGPVAPEKGWLVRWGFNAAVVLIALLIAWLITGTS